MEMHQVRYFLAVARTLNFTRAAEECNVSQPSLTRAVKLLEYELGGDLLRRERSHTHLTELGERMLPLLAQCFESAASAKAIAAAMKSRKLAALRLGLPHSVDVLPLMPHIVELLAQFEGLAFRLVRGSAAEIAEALREGIADLAVCGPQEMAWDRFESWPLFAEPLRLAFLGSHRFANRESVQVQELEAETLILRRFCETHGAVETILAGQGIDLGFAVEAGSERDALAFLAAGAGVLLAPVSLTLPAGVRAARLESFDLTRELRVYAVAGRHRGPAAAMLVTQLRAADWSAFHLAQRQPASATA
jgi:DNA-binding transcriptional LysR family regulator